MSCKFAEGEVVSGSNTEHQHRGRLSTADSRDSKRTNAAKRVLRQSGCNMVSREVRHYLQRNVRIVDLFAEIHRLWSAN